MRFSFNMNTLQKGNGKRKGKASVLSQLNLSASIPLKADRSTFVYPKHALLGEAEF
jgi:hypothetical protein